MKFTNNSNTILLSVLFVVLFAISGCAGKEYNTTTTDKTNLIEPTKKIFIFNGDTSRPYDILGEVSYTSEGESLYGTNSVLNGPTASPELKIMLKKVAFTKFGEKVDAVINTDMQGHTNGGYFGLVAGSFGAKNLSVTVSGLAIHFQ